jgi:RNA polymerase sigma factor (sigma-70 family)
VSGREPFERVVAVHGRTVWRVCRGLLAEHDAEDAWAETMLAALNAYGRLAPASDLRAGLVTIAHRKAVDVTRGRRRQPVPMAEAPDGTSTLGDPQAADTDLWGAVGRLPDKQRMAVAYHYLGGLPYQQVADLLGGSAEAARRAAADGIKHLRALPGLDVSPTQGAHR